MQIDGFHVDQVHCHGMFGIYIEVLYCKHVVYLLVCTQCVYLNLAACTVDTCRLSDAPNCGLAKREKT